MCKNPGSLQEGSKETTKKVVNPSDKGNWQSPFASWTDEDWKTRKFPTRAELKAVIPDHCFKRSWVKGFLYILRDILFGVIGVVVFKFLGLSAELPETAAGYPLWVSSWLLYGLVESGIASGVWGMGHECGHGAFSEYAWLNDLVGWVLHSLCLIPYFSWQFSHAKHHRRTNDMIEGETHVPETFDDAPCGLRYQVYKVLGARGYAVFDIFTHLTLLYPLYFLGLCSIGRNGADGKPIERGTWVDHYRPTSRMFPPKMRTKVILSDLGILIMLGILYCFAMEHGFLAVFLWYGLPISVMNHVYLVYITWLQHTHPSIPHFGESEWTWVKGTLVGTVDRPHSLIDFFGHHIGSTHIVHHLFHEIPWYNAIEATKHVRAFLEPKGMYNVDPTYQWKVTYLLAKTCHYVDSNEGIQFYKSFLDKMADSKDKIA